MILDAREFKDKDLLSADVCIVGAGAAGISIALDLIDSGLDVLLLESGGYEEEEKTQALYAGSVADERLHSPPDRYRQRRFGGSTTIWGGRCMPLDPIDFEARDFMPHSGWPIGLDDLLPYYRRANALAEAGEYAYTTGEAFTRAAVPRPMIEGFASSNFSTDTLERFSCPTNFGARYGHKLAAAANLRVILHANVTSIALDASGNHVEQLRARVLDGQAFRIAARRFVLAVGGLEVVRLLLASRDRQASGVGNRYDVVGRYYMCHVAGTIGTLHFKGPPSSVHHGYDLSEEGIYCRQRIALRPEAQRRLKLGNFIARLHHPRITDPVHRDAVLSLLYLAKFIIPYEYAKRLHSGNPVSWPDWFRHVRNVLTRPFDAIGFAWHMLRDRRLAERKFPSIIIRSRVNLYSLDFHAEQQPNPDSRVTLSRETDALDMPKLSIDWRYAPGDVATVRETLALLADEIKASGLGRFDYDPDEVELEMTRYGAYGGHHIGTARMGEDPRSSVVDSDCRVHGVDNLYIASSAVFPTSSQANPTLTIIALALRLAAHLQAQAALDGQLADAGRPRPMSAAAPAPAQAQPAPVRG